MFIFGVKSSHHTTWSSPRTFRIAAPAPAKSPASRIPPPSPPPLPQPPSWTSLRLCPQLSSWPSSPAGKAPWHRNRPRSSSSSLREERGRHLNQIRPLSRQHSCHFGHLHSVHPFFCGHLRLLRYVRRKQRKSKGLSYCLGNDGKVS